MIYVTGDTHGQLAKFDLPQLHKLRAGDTLLITGDFGFLWDGSKEEMNTLKKLAKKPYNICFVDGTHENFDLLDRLKVKLWKGGKVHQLAPNIFHLMRGQVFKIEDQTIFAMGGGESPDIEIRFEMNTWSDKEFPTKEELLEGVENLQALGGNVDIVLTHEPPAKIKDFLLLKTHADASITAINTYLEDVGKTCTFKHWYFGSLHLDKFISTTHICVFNNILNAKTGTRV
ncbi:MAG: metallophosphoesterase [Clostridia bacterium]|nr:metallophosphoesterase [Clostridia bacterium]MBR3552558.1 metallophosphoesterase [Clostridia bacterium]